MNTYTAANGQYYPYSMQDPSSLSLCNMGYYIVPPQNRFVYVKQNFVQPMQPQIFSAPTVHINPNFNKKVFVNPNFHGNTLPASDKPKIHINPNSHKIKLSLSNTTQNSNMVKNVKINKIHVNPNVLKNIPVPIQNKKTPIKDASMSNKIIYSSRSKLIRKPGKLQSVSSAKKMSIHTKYKIIKSPVLKKMILNDTKKKVKYISPMQYKLLRIKTPTGEKKNNRYNLDKRLSNNLVSKNSDQRNTNLKLDQMKYKKNNLLRIGDILYRKSTHSLRRTSDVKKTRRSSLLKVQTNAITKSRYKFVRKSLNKSITQNTPLLKRSNSKTKLRIVKVKKVLVSPGKLKKCNIPCPLYRKFGRCRQHERGICFKKHDPNQIALCTKFLQGACVNGKCLLSHNVSHEKMPTCKYYLEGACSKDECPYLHVRISPKAEICKDFLEGFCKKAKECDKRHQFLCPDYEKHGTCLKQRCPYPHGKMVRKYSVFIKDKFAKKSSEIQMSTTKKDESRQSTSKNDEIQNTILIGYENTTKNEDTEAIIKNTRYYAEPEFLESSTSTSLTENACDQEFSLRYRPKLGCLPSYIAFQDS